MKINALIPLTLLVASVPASAQASPRANIDRLLGRIFADSNVPPLADVPALDSPAAAAANTHFPASLLDGLSPIKDSDRALVAKHLPQLKDAPILEIDLDRGDKILDAVTKDPNHLISSIEFFSDDSFSGSLAYFVSRATIEKLIDTYDVPVLTPLSGKIEDDGTNPPDVGQDIHLDGIVIGNKHVYVLYDHGSPTHRVQVNSPAIGQSFSITDVVDQQIDGPGQISFPPIKVSGQDDQPGLQVVAVVGTVSLLRVTKTGSREDGTADVEVETDFWLARKRAETVDPIRRKQK